MLRGLVAIDLVALFANFYPIRCRRCGYKGVVCTHFSRRFLPLMCMHREAGIASLARINKNCILYTAVTDKFKINNKSIVTEPFNLHHRIKSKNCGVGTVLLQET